MPNNRGKRWCFTLNNPTQEEREFLLKCLEDMKECSETSTRGVDITYLIFGEEQVTTLHLQGYMELKTKRALSKLKKFLRRAHWEKAKGTPKQAAEYCKKDGKYWEIGTLMTPGRRSDLETIREKIQTGASELEIAEQHFSQWVVYRRSFSRYKALLSNKRDWMTKVIVLWGDTGVGKTRFVMNQIMDLTFWSPGDYKWFDGYKGQDVVLFDDYRGEYPLALFLKLTDRYPMSVPVKGNFTNWCPKKIYITSNCSPSVWYKDADNRSLEAFWRRLDVVHFINKNIY